MQKPFCEVIMTVRLFLFLCTCLLFPVWLNAQQSGKIPLDHSVYDSWKDLAGPVISRNGDWVAVEINPQKGDGRLLLTAAWKTDSTSFHRAYNAAFSPDAGFLAFKIKAPEDSIRKAKIAKKKTEEMPKDSLGIFLLQKKELKKYQRIWQTA